MNRANVSSALIAMETSSKLETGIIDTCIAVVVGLTGLQEGEVICTKRSGMDQFSELEIHLIT